jgi:drug/metabolite transporter (DMT)-like permease
MPFLGKTKLDLWGINRYFVFSGAAASSGLIFVYTAYRFTDLIIAVALANTTPIFSLVFAYIFLKRFEKINLQTIASALAVVVGSILILLG